jgi:hypothetical protein
VRFFPQERHHGPLVVTANGREIARLDPVCDVNRMAVDHRWNNLEDVRRAKSRIGNMLVHGGAITAAYGVGSDSEGAALVGIGMMLLGMLAKAGAAADTRYLEFAPQSIYLAPVTLVEPCELRVGVAGDDGASVILPDFQPGRPGAPRAVYLRLHGLDSPDPQWLLATASPDGNDVTSVPRGDRTPQTDSMGYKRLMYSIHSPYQ